MSRTFLATRPLQAGKLAVVVGTLPFGLLGFFRLVPGQQLVGLLLALVVTGETLVAGYRAAPADESPTDRLTARPAYTVVRAVEAGVALLAAGGVVATVVTVPDEPVAGPGAIGLLFVVATLGLFILAATLVRVAAEYHYYRRDRAAGERPVTSVRLPGADCACGLPRAPRPSSRFDGFWW